MHILRNISLNGINYNGFQGDPRQGFGLNHFSGFTQIQAPPEMKKHLPEIAMMIYQYIAGRANNNRMRCIHYNMLVAENGTNPELQILTTFVGNLVYMKIKENAFSNLSQAVNTCVQWVVDRRINFIVINEPNLFRDLQDIASDIQNQASEYVIEADNVANFLSNTYMGGHVSANQGFGGNNTGGVALSGFGGDNNNTMGGFGGGSSMSGFGQSNNGGGLSSVITRVDNNGNTHVQDNKFERDMVGLESQYKEAPKQKKEIITETNIRQLNPEPVVNYYHDNGKPNLEVCRVTTEAWCSSIYQPFAIAYNKREFEIVNKLLPSKDGRKNFVISSLKKIEMDRSAHTLPTTELFLSQIVPEKVQGVVVTDRKDFINKTLVKAVDDIEAVREVKAENEFLTAVNMFREQSIVTIKDSFRSIDEALSFGRLTALQYRSEDFGVYNIEFTLEKNFAIDKNDAEVLLNLGKSTTFNSLVSKMRCIIEDGEVSHSLRMSILQINSYLGAKFIEFIKFYLCIEEFHGMDSFIDDVLDLINIIGDDYGQTYKETLVASQQRFIKTYFTFNGVIEDNVETLNDPNTPENEKDLKNDVAMLRVSTPAIIACTEFLDSELALAVPRYIGATFSPKTISENLYNLFDELVKNNFSVGLGSEIKRFFLATADDKIYEINIGISAQAPLLIRKVYY